MRWSVVSPLAFACINGAYIPLKRPLVNYQDFSIKNTLCSLHFRAVCDGHSRFKDVEFKRLWSVPHVLITLNPVKIPHGAFSLLLGYDLLPSYIN